MVFKNARDAAKFLASVDDFQRDPGFRQSVRNMRNTLSWNPASVAAMSYDDKACRRINQLLPAHRFWPANFPPRAEISPANATQRQVVHKITDL